MKKLSTREGINSFTETVLVINELIAEARNYQTPVSAITPGASPYTYQNTSGKDEDIIISGGTVSAIAFSRDGITFYTTGQTAGIFRLNHLDKIKVTYSSTPTMTRIPR